MSEEENIFFEHQAFVELLEVKRRLRRRGVDKIASGAQEAIIIND